MSEITVYTLDEKIKQCIPRTPLEKDLQNLIEGNMELFFGVRFLKSEFKTTDGRMDSIGIDENNCPVIFEYKRSQNENIINQGLFYLDWLLDHKGDYRNLVREKLGEEVENLIDWAAPSVICIAQDFSKYDLHAVNQMQRNIKLVKYRIYDNNCIVFDFLNSPSFTLNVSEEINEKGSGSNAKSEENYTFSYQFKKLSPELKNLYYSICDYIESLGDNISSSDLKLYKAYKTVKNFVCIVLQRKTIILSVQLDPKTVKLEKGFTEDKTNKGHWGTGNLDVSIKDKEDFEKAKPLILRAYEEA